MAPSCCSSSCSCCCFLGERACPTLPAVSPAPFANSRRPRAGSRRKSSEPWRSPLLHGVRYRLLPLPSPITGSITAASRPLTIPTTITLITITTQGSIPPALQATKSIRRSRRPHLPHLSRPRPFIHLLRKTPEHRSPISPRRKGPHSLPPPLRVPERVRQGPQQRFRNALGRRSSRSPVATAT